MTGHTTNHADRRTFLARCARTVALGGIAAAAGVLVSRRQVGGCPYESFPCAACRELAHCGLPAGLAARGHQGKQEQP